MKKNLIILILTLSVLAVGQTSLKRSVGNIKIGTGTPTLNCNVGDKYFDDATSKEYFCTAANTWNISGNIILIQEQILGADTATVTFSSIPQNYRHLKLICYGRITGAITVDTVYIKFNEDAGTNYDSQYAGGQGSTATSLGALGQGAGIIGTFPGTSSSRATEMGTCEVTIPFYTNTSFDKHVQILSGVVYSTASTSNNPILRNHIFGWRSTAAVTRLDITSGSDFKTGSSFSLYGSF
jgi:hypothetical protein